MTTDLDRRFAPWTKGQADPERAPFARRPHDGLAWPDLLKRSRVVLLAEAGSGKSTELRQREKALSESGFFVFRATVQEIASAGFDAAIGTRGLAHLARWRASEDLAWFLIDSVDEAKARNLDLETALRRLADAIHGAERRARVVLTGRHTDWEFERDLATLEEAIPVPRDAPPPEPDAASLLLAAARRAKKPKAAAPEKPTVVVMLPLDRGRAEAFAKARGVDDLDKFFDAMESANLTPMARRPLDLEWLADYWRKHRKFGSYRDMVSLGVERRLVEARPERARLGALAFERANSGVQRVGAALAFGRLDSVAVPDGGMGAGRPGSALGLADAFPDWEATDVARLIALPIFDPAEAGCAKLHNDNEEATRSLLAARWLSTLAAANCPAKAIRELLFATSHGMKVAKPSMRQTAAWLSLCDRDVARELARRDPAALMRWGDPASLQPEIKRAALDSAIRRAGTEDFDASLGHDALRRFAQSGIGDLVRESLLASTASDEQAELLLRIVWLGKLRSCLDLAESAALADGGTDLARAFAGRCVAEMGGAEARGRLAAHLLSHRASISGHVFWHGVEHLFPGAVTAAALAAVVSDDGFWAKVDDDTLGDTLPDLARRVDDPEGARELLKAALQAMPRGPGSDAQAHPAAPFVDACALRFVELSLEPPALAVEATLRLAEAYDGSSPTDWPLPIAICATPAGRRSLFWTAAEELPKTELFRGARLIGPRMMSAAGLGIPLELDDCNWILADAPAHPDDLTLAANTLLGLWREAGEPEDLAAAIGQLAASHPAVAEARARWLAPPPRPAAPDPARAAYAEKARIAEAEREGAWKKFADGLRTDPAKLRPLAADISSRADEELWTIYGLHPNALDGRAGHSDPDLSPLEAMLGAAAVAEFRSTLKLRWRLWSPDPSEPEGQRCRKDFLGVLGIALEAADDRSWASRLSEGETRLACRHALRALNGFPPWFAALCDARAPQVRAVLSDGVEASFYPGPVDQPRRLLEKIAESDEASAAVALDAMALLEALAPRSVAALEPALRIVVRGLADNDRARAFIQAEMKDAGGPRRVACLVGAACAIDPDFGAEILLAELKSDDRGKRTALCQQAFPRVFGDMRGNQSFAGQMSVSHLERLVVAGFEALSLDEDNQRPGGKAYTPDDRDIAERARDSAFSALARRPGIAAFDALLRLAKLDGFPVPPRRLARLARERAAEDSESAPWTDGDAREFERTFLARPRTAKDLQAVALSRIDDIQHELLQGDFNQGVTLAGLSDEREVQNWTADRLRGGQGESFSVEREPHVAEEKEPDIRLRAKATDASLPIEIKVVESWSLAELEEALTVQLMGRYLKDRNHGWGVLLLVHQEPRPRGWASTRSGGFLDLASVVDHLRSIAGSIAAGGADAPQMAVALIDVSAVSAKIKATPGRRNSTTNSE